MTYELFLGDYTFSSWSLRAWLLFDRFGIPAAKTMVWFGEVESVADQLKRLAPPAKTVPACRFPEDVVIGDSLAIAEELASRHPAAGFWPEDTKSRAIARGLAAEMHSSFTALRTTCPMDLRRCYQGFEPPDDVLADVSRIEAIWARARADTESTAPWLCGEYSVADAFYAPVAARMLGYGLPISEQARAYALAHLADPSFRRWRAMALVRGKNHPWYAQDLKTTDWPGPTAEFARQVSGGPSKNERCPYSGKPVTHFIEYQGHTWGFCNAFCRDKTAADPTAWNAFTDMVSAH